MVAVFYSIVQPFLLPCVYGIHYMVAIRLWFLVHGNNTCMVLSLKNLNAYGF